MNVGADDAIGGTQISGAAQIHIFTDFSNHIRQNRSHIFAGYRAGESFQAFNIALDSQSSLGGIFNIILKNIVLGNEVGFGVYFNNRTGIAFYIYGYQTFCGDTAGFFGSGSQAFFAEPVNCLFHIAIGFNQRLFAIQHAGTGGLS